MNTKYHLKYGNKFFVKLHPRYGADLTNNEGEARMFDSVVDAYKIGEAIPFPGMQIMSVPGTEPEPVQSKSRLKRIAAMKGEA